MLSQTEALMVSAYICCPHGSNHMKEQRSDQTVDTILVPLFETRDEAESQRLLEHLLADHILPVSKEIIHHKLRAHTAGRDQQDSEDVQNNVVLKLLSTLRECRHNPDSR